MNQVKFSLIIFITIFGLTAQIRAATGDLDLSFGVGGKVVTPIGTSQDEGHTVAIQTDGKIVVAGFINAGFLDYDFVIVRYNADGSLDATFGTGGKVTTNFGFNGSSRSSEQASSMAIQADGKIVVAGQSNFGVSSTSFAVARYNPDGSLDTSFDGDGKVVTSVGTGQSFGNAVAIQSDGKIVVAGASERAGGGADCAVVRYNTDGLLDTSFNATGKVTTSISSGNNAQSVVVQADGKIVTAGYALQSTLDFALIRYNSDGSLDSSFGTAGQVLTSIGSGTEYALAVKLQTDGKIVAFGQAEIAGSQDFAVVRYSTNGSLDTSFDGDGIVTTPISANRPDSARSGTIQPDGKIIAAGSAEVGAANDPNFALVRYNSNGSLDNTFGTSGIVTTGISANDNDDVINGVALQLDGNIVAAGQSNSLAVNSAQDFALARYVGDSPSCFAVSMPASQTVYRNAFTTIPVNIAGNTTGQGIYSFDFTLTFDANVLDFQFPSPSGTTSAGFTVTANEISPGTLRVSGFGTSPMSGTGMMLKLNFIPIGAIGATSQLNLSNFQLNEGSPCSTTQNGQTTVIGGSISGIITYGTSAAITPVSNATVTAAGTPTISQTTGANGNYFLGGLGAGAYTVTPSKTSDVNGISALDASLVVQHLVGIAVLTPNQQSAGDASGNGSLSSFDASLIARFVIGSPNTMLAGTWKFLPATRTYSNIISDLTGEDYAAILVGEVSGNWTSDSLIENAWGQDFNQSRITISLPKISAKRNSIVTIPIMLENYGGQNITAYQFDLLYNPAIIQPAEIPFDKTSTLSGNFSVEVNAIESGRLRVAVFGANSLAGSGTLLNLQFRVVGPLRRSSNLTWQAFQFNEGEPRVKPTDGKLTVR